MIVKNEYSRSWIIDEGMHLIFQEVEEFQFVCRLAERESNSAIA